MKKLLLDFIENEGWLDHRLDSNIVVNTIVEKWENGKKDLMPFFGENLIIEKDIVVEPNEHVRINQFKELSCNDFFYRLRKRVKLDSKKLIKQMERPESLINGFLEENVEIQMLNGEVFNFTKGTKLMKVFRKMSKGLEIYYENMRLEHSKIIQVENKEVTMCVSIHPLDFLTMSYNNHGWHSCFGPGGDYWRAPYSLLQDSKTVIVYLKPRHTNRNLKFGDHEWNSKMWRTTIIITENAIIGGKGYPYEDLNLMEIAINMVQENVGKHSGGKFLTTQGQSWIEGICPTEEIDTSKRVFRVVGDSGGEFYNDYCENQCFRTLIKTFKPISSLKVKLNIAPYCLLCGENNMFGLDMYCKCQQEDCGSTETYST